MNKTKIYCQAGLDSSEIDDQYAKYGTIGRICAQRTYQERIGSLFSHAALKRRTLSNTFHTIKCDQFKTG